MTKVSKYLLDKTVQQEMFKQFWSSVSRLHDAGTASAFFTDLLTDTEEMMLAKRFTSAVLLLRGKRPVDIVSTLHVSYSMVGSVASWLKNAKPHTRTLLLSIIKESNWQTLLDRIDALLDQLPPVYGTDWSATGKQKWVRKVQRSARQSLR